MEEAKEAVLELLEQTEWRSELGRARRNQEEDDEENRLGDEERMLRAFREIFVLESGESLLPSMCS